MEQATVSKGTTLLGGPARFAGGLNEVGDGVFAWLQPNGGLGESNAGLVVGEGESLLVDTLFDLRLTRRMLDAMAEPTASAPIRTLVNTHSDADHFFGNQLVHGAEILSTAATAAVIALESPADLSRLVGLSKLMRLAGRQPLPLPRKAKLAATGEYFGRVLAAYDFSGITATPPTRTFEGSMSLDVGGRAVELFEVGPAHTEGDLIVYIPSAKVVFAADLLFIGATPIMWVGPVGNWTAAIDQILELDAEAIVPGHGPVTDRAGAIGMRDYWSWLAVAARERFDAGVGPRDAARDILRSPDFAAREFASWDAPERIVVNVDTLYREFRGQPGRCGKRERLDLFMSMASLAAERT